MRWSAAAQQHALLLLILSASILYFLIQTGLASALVHALKGDQEEQMLTRYKMSARRHIQWSADGDGEDNSTLKCRNSRQGRDEVADDRGFVCSRSRLDSSGCCSPSSPRFTCDDCDQATSCCARFERCVSCCLRPDQKQVLVSAVEGLSGHRVRQLMAARDQFGLCLQQCRTSSASVHHENKYRREGSKYCYAIDAPLTHADLDVTAL